MSVPRWFLRSARFVPKPHRLQLLWTPPCERSIEGQGLRAGKPSDKRNRGMDDPSHGENNVGELGFSSYTLFYSMILLIF